MLFMIMKIFSDKLQGMFHRSEKHEREGAKYKFSIPKDFTNDKKKIKKALGEVE